MQPSCVFLFFLFIYIFQSFNNLHLIFFRNISFHHILFHIEFLQFDSRFLMLFIPDNYINSIYCISKNPATYNCDNYTDNFFCVCSGGNISVPYSDHSNKRKIKSFNINYIPFDSFIISIFLDPRRSFSIFHFYPSYCVEVDST